MLSRSSGKFYHEVVLKVLQPSNLNPDLDNDTQQQALWALEQLVLSYGEEQ